MDIPLIVSRQGFSEEMPNEIRTIQSKLNIVAIYDLLYNASVFVKDGFGYALAFDKLINTSNDSSLCFRPIVPKIISPMKIIWSINQTMSKSSKIFLDELKFTLADMISLD